VTQLPNLRPHFTFFITCQNVNHFVFPPFFPAIFPAIFSRAKLSLTRMRSLLVLIPRRFFGFFAGIAVFLQIDLRQKGLGFS